VKDYSKLKKCRRQESLEHDYLLHKKTREEEKEEEENEMVARGKCPSGISYALARQTDRQTKCVASCDCQVTLVVGLRSHSNVDVWPLSLTVADADVCGLRRFIAPTDASRTVNCRHDTITSAFPSPASTQTDLLSTAPP